MAKSKKSQEPKLPKGITKEFVEETDRSSTEQLKSMIVRFQGQIEEIKAFLKNDEANLNPEQYAGAQKLQELKAAYDEAAAPSNEAKGVLQAKTKFVVEALKKSGAL